MQCNAARHEHSTNTAPYYASGGSSSRQLTLHHCYDVITRTPQAERGRKMSGSGGSSSSLASPIRADTPLIRVNDFGSEVSAMTSQSMVQYMVQYVWCSMYGAVYGAVLG